jgi:hypothetical protein
MKVAELIQEYRDKHPDNELQCLCLASCLANKGPVEFDGRLWIGYVGPGGHGVENHPLPPPKADRVNVPESVLARRDAEIKAAILYKRMQDAEG